MKNLITNIAIKIIHPILLILTSLIYIVYTLIIMLFIFILFVPCFILPSKKADELYLKISNTMLKLNKRKR